MSDNVQAYLQAIGKFKLLTPREEVDLSRQIQAALTIQETLEKENRQPNQEEKIALRNGKTAKEKMANCNLRLVVSIAKRYTNRGLDLLDLVQEGSIGILRAAEKFDPERGYRFSTYATWWIRQAMTRSLSSTSRTIKIPIHTVNLIRDIKTFVSSYKLENKKYPSLIEISEQFNRHPDFIQQILLVNRGPLSLDMTMGKDDDLTLLHLLGDPKSENTEDLSLDVHWLLGQIEEKEAHIIRSHYGLLGEDKTLKEIGDEMNLSRERVRQLQTRGFRTMRRIINRDSNSRKFRSRLPAQPQSAEVAVEFPCRV